MPPLEKNYGASACSGFNRCSKGLVPARSSRRKAAYSNSPPLIRMLMDGKCPFASLACAPWIGWG